MPNRNPPIIQELNRQLLRLQRFLYNFWIQKIKRMAFKTGLPAEYFRQKYGTEMNIAIHKFVESVYFQTIEQLQRKLFLRRQRRRRRHERQRRQERRERERLQEERRRRQQQQKQYQQYQQQQRQQGLQVPAPRTQQIEILSPTAAADDIPTIDTALQSLPSSFFTTVLDINNINQIATTTTDNYFNAVGRLLDRASTVSWSLKITTLETIHQLMLFSEMAAFQRVANYAAYNTFNTAIQSKLQQINDDDTQLRYVTAKDERTCEICKPLDGKIYRTDDLSAPDPPLHPNCRCWLEPIIII